LSSAQHEGKHALHFFCCFIHVIDRGGEEEGDDGGVPSLAKRKESGE
jgi:hypothetical protein